MTDQTIYAEPQQPALPISDFVLDLEHAALVITDPQIENFRFLASAVWTTAEAVAVLKEGG